MPAAGHALFFGAGASVAWPAELPLFAAIRDALAQRLGLDRDSKLLHAMAPEVLLDQLQRAEVPVQTVLREILSGGQPNALHNAAVYLLAAGGSVWTTNLDDLIERAAEQQGVKIHLVLPGQHLPCSCQRGHLYKPHGTIRSGQMALGSDQLFRPLAPDWEDAMRRGFRGQQVAVVGYAGFDLDLRGALDQALSEAADIHWFAIAGAVSGRDRLPLTAKAGSLNVHLASASDPRPDRLFIAWAKQQRLVEQSDESLAWLDRMPDQTLRLPEFKVGHVARGSALDLVGDLAGARRSFRLALLNPSETRRAARGLLSLGLVHGAVWRGPLLGLLAAVTEDTPLGRRRSLWRWRLRGLGFVYQPIQTVAAAEAALRRFPDDPQFGLELGSAAKLTSDLTRARQVLEDTRADEAHRPSADSRARRAGALVYNLSFVCRWQGELDRAEAYADELAAGLGGLAGLTWATWGQTELANLAILRGQFAEGLRLLEEVEERFALLGNQDGLIDTDCFRLPALRMVGLDVEAQEAAANARRRFEQRLPRSLFRHQAIAFEEGELARAAGDMKLAESSYRELVDSPRVVHSVLGLLGIGECQRARGVDPEAARRALEMSQAGTFPFGVIHAAITIALVEDAFEKKAGQIIAASGYPAPTRSDGEHGVRRYCLGPKPEEHRMAFP